MIEPGHQQLSIRRQCELVGLNRSTFYYKPGQESDLNLRLMRLIDTYYTKAPFYGRRRMTAHLRCQGYEINHKRVRRLMQKMGLPACCGQAGDLPQTSNEHGGQRAQGLSVPAAEPGDHTPKPGVEHRHYLHSYVTWFYVPRSCDRLV